MNKPWQKRARVRRLNNRKAEKRKRSIAQHNSGFLVAYWIDDNNVLRRSRMGSPYWKNQSNRKVRRTLDVRSGGEYKKHSEYWWAIW